MRISHLRRFVYIAIPRTGSTSIRMMLDRYSEVSSKNNQEFPHHISSFELKNVFAEKDWDWNSYHKFTVVRNPWARLLSTHNYRLNVAKTAPTKNLLGKDSQFYNICLEYSKCTDFNENIKRGRIKVSQQVDWIMNERFPDWGKKWDSNSEIIVDSICRLETLRDDLASIWAKLGLNPEDLTSIPHENKSSHEFYRDSYDEESKNIVSELFSDDISLFGYSF